MALHSLAGFAGGNPSFNVFVPCRPVVFSVALSGADSPFEVSMGFMEVAQYPFYVPALPGCRPQASHPLRSKTASLPMPPPSQIYVPASSPTLVLSLSNLLLIRPPQAKVASHPPIKLRAQQRDHLDIFLPFVKLSPSSIARILLSPTSSALSSILSPRSPRFSLSSPLGPPRFSLTHLLHSTRFSLRALLDSLFHLLCALLNFLSAQRMSVFRPRPFFDRLAWLL